MHAGTLLSQFLHRVRRSRAPIALRLPRVHGMHMRQRRKKMNQRSTNLMNRARSLSLPAYDRSGALHSVLNFLSYAMVMNLMIFPRCIYAILMAKDSNCAQNKLKFHTAKK